MRTLKYHEQKLLKKHNFFDYKHERSAHEVSIIRRYRLSSREEYISYNRVAGYVQKMTSLLERLEASDPVRIEFTRMLLDKLYEMGLVSTKRSLAVCERLGPAAISRRRLPVMLVAMKFAPNLKQATEMVQQGHIRVGPHVVSNPAYLVPRDLEDHIHWVDDSKYRKHILQYSQQMDHFDIPHS